MKNKTLLFVMLAVVITAFGAACVSTESPRPRAISPRQSAPQIEQALLKVTPLGISEQEARELLAARVKLKYPPGHIQSSGAPARGSDAHGHGPEAPRVGDQHMVVRGGSYLPNILNPFITRHAFAYYAFEEGRLIDIIVVFEDDGL